MEFVPLGRMSRFFQREPEVAQQAGFAWRELDGSGKGAGGSLRVVKQHQQVSDLHARRRGVGRIHPQSPGQERRERCAFVGVRELDELEAPLRRVGSILHRCPGIFLDQPVIGRRLPQHQPEIVVAGGIRGTGPNRRQQFFPRAILLLVAMEKPAQLTMGLGIARVQGDVLLQLASRLLEAVARLQSPGCLPQRVLPRHDLFHQCFHVPDSGFNVHGANLGDGMWAGQAVAGPGRQGLEQVVENAGPFVQPLLPEDSHRRVPRVLRLAGVP